jgi:uncharacterized membrane protein
MSDTSQSPTAASLRLAALLSYGLMLVACANGFTGLVGVVLAYVKRDDARGTIYESHFSNIITVFWSVVAIVVVFVAAAGAGAIYFFAGVPDAHRFMRLHLPEIVGGGIVLCCAGVAFAVWYLYRIIKGLLRALEERAYS